MELRINKDGKITIPKKLRDKYNLQPGTEMKINDLNDEFTLEPMHKCSACKKALPKELYDRGSCLECPPPKRIKIY